MNYLILAAGLALLGVAHAGHEFPIYPSFYPRFGMAFPSPNLASARVAAPRLARS